MLKHRIRFFLIFTFIMTAGTLSAWESEQSFGANFAYYPDNHQGYPDGGGFLAPSYSPLSPENDGGWTGGSSNPDINSSWESGDPEARQLGNGWGAAELEVYYRLQAVTSFLAGSGSLTKDNNLTFSFKPVFTPVSLHVEGEVHWTPLAFFVVDGGFLLGTGWTVDFLGLHGLAMNNDDDITGTDISGLVGQVFLGGTFQFDLAALVPGDFNHVVIQASAKALYMGYTKAGNREPWYWRADKGENFNAWEYRGDYALGWMPPWKVNFIGFVAEHRFWLSRDIRKMSTIDSGGWGSDFHEWRFGPAVNVELAENHGLTILLQFKNGLYYSADTIYARWFERWYTTGDRYIKIDRLALAYSWNF